MMWSLLGQLCPSLQFFGPENPYAGTSTLPSQVIEAHDESDRGANVVELVATPLSFPGTEPAGEFKHRLHTSVWEVAL